jgi:hypothetical protein
MAYSRAAAVQYAEKYWNTPCDDGVIWLSKDRVVVASVRGANAKHTQSWRAAPLADGWMPYLVDDQKGGEKAVFRRGGGGSTEEILIADDVDDCAHFVSRCLTAGGASLNDGDLPSLFRRLLERSDARVLCENVGKLAGQRVIDSGLFKPGDVIGYCNVRAGATQCGHLAVYVGKIGDARDGGVSCHTFCRFPGKSQAENSWWQRPEGHYAYTLIHFVSDDPVPDAERLKRLVGWWRVEYLARTEYYLVEKDGTAAYTTRPPAKGQTSLVGAEGKAHWFMTPGRTITFVWRKGMVEEWSPDRDGFRCLINGGVQGRLTRLS